MIKKLKLTKEEFRFWLEDFISYWSSYKSETSKTYTDMARAVKFAIFAEPKIALMDNHSLPWNYDELSHYLNSAIEIWRESIDTQTHFPKQTCINKMEAFMSIKGALFNEI